MGWSANWDEDVTPERVRPGSSESKHGTEIAAANIAPPAAASLPAGSPPAAGAWKTGDKVDVQWNGAWWAAQVLSTNGTTYKVHYVGWASSWDESVPSSRVRASTPTAKRGSGPA